MLVEKGYGRVLNVILRATRLWVDSPTAWSRSVVRVLGREEASSLMPSVSCGLQETSSKQRQDRGDSIPPETRQKKPQHVFTIVSVFCADDFEWYPVKCHQLQWVHRPQGGALSKRAAVYPKGLATHRHQVLRSRTNPGPWLKASSWGHHLQKSENKTILKLTC